LAGVFFTAEVTVFFRKYFVFACLMQGVFSLSWSNIHFLDAMISMGNYNQAYMMLNRMPNQDANTALYRGLLQFCLGGHSDGLSMLQSFYESADSTTRRRCFEFLLAYLEKTELPLFQVQAVGQLFQDESKNHSDWFFVLSSARYREGLFAEIIADSSEPVSEKEFDLLFNAYRALKKEKEFYARFINNPPGQYELWSSFIRRLFKEGNIEVAERLFRERENSLSVEQRAEQHIFFGSEQGDFSRQEKGWRLRLSLSPLNFDFIRGLASLYYLHGQPEKAETELFTYLKNGGGQVLVARNVVRIMNDHGRFQELISFVHKYRQESGNSLIFAEVLLPVYAHQQNFPAFFGELDAVHRGFYELIWAKALFDHFDTFNLELAFSEFLKFYAHSKKTGPRTLSILAGLMENGESVEWISNYFASLPEEMLSFQLKEAFKNREYVSILCMLGGLIAHPERLSFAFCRLGGVALFNLSRFEEALPLLLRASENAETADFFTLLALIQTVCETGGYTHRVADWVGQMGPVSFERLNERSRKDVFNACLRSLFFLDREEELQEFLKRSSVTDVADITYIDTLRLLKQKKYQEFQQSLQTFLHNETDSPNYTDAVFLYVLFLENQELWQEVFFERILDAWFAWNGGRFEDMSRNIDEAQAMLDGHYALSSLQKTIDFLKIAALEQGKIAKKPGYEEKWFRGIELFVHNYPDFIYNSRLVEKLVRYYIVMGMEREKNELVKDYLLKKPFTLSAQKLRNSLL
jgi:hypothetical protein